MDEQTLRRRELRNKLQQYLDEAATQALCFDLGITYEHLAGQSVDMKQLALIQWMERRRRLPELVDALRKEHAHVAWPDVPQPEGVVPYRTPGDRGCPSFWYPTAATPISAGA